MSSLIFLLSFLDFNEVCKLSRVFLTLIIMLAFNILSYFTVRHYKEVLETIFLGVLVSLMQIMIVCIYSLA